MQGQGLPSEYFGGTGHCGMQVWSEAQLTSNMNRYAAAISSGLFSPKNTKDVVLFPSPAPVLVYTCHSVACNTSKTHLVGAMSKSLSMHCIALHCIGKIIVEKRYFT